jgi:RNA polymerase sigma-70 factor (ECF subfamily)
MATQRLLDRYLQAWEDSDIAALTAILRDDALLSMPPLPSWYRGRSAVARIISAMAFAGNAQNRWRMLPTSANDQPAFAFYERAETQSDYRAYGLQVLAIRGGLIAGIIAFVGGPIVQHFGLPLTLER